MRKQSLLKRSVAMALVSMMLIGMTGCADGMGNNGMENVGGELVVYAAEYPKMNPYPETDGFEYDEKEFKAWAETRNQMKASSDEYLSGVWAFSEDTMAMFLKETGGGNKIYSPVNIYLALGMLAEVTDGESRNQVLELLHADDIETLRQRASDLFLENYCDDGRLTSRLGASIWLDTNVNYVPETLKQIAEVYRASSYQGQMGTAEMNAALQNWLNEQTGGLLKDQASQIELEPEAILALATTLYFQAKWDNRFSEKQTKEDTFFAPNGNVTCEFMNDSDSGFYYWSENFAAIRKTFEAGGGMFFFLPDEDVTVEELLEDEKVLDLLKNYVNWEDKKYLTINQSIPKFDVVSDMSLIEQLKELGVTDVFDRDVSDFSPLTKDMEGIFVSQVEHAARVKIDEEGCEAAAYTVIVACGAAMPPEEEVDFVLNRPFLFAITGDDGLPLFVGVVNQP